MPFASHGVPAVPDTLVSVTSHGQEAIFPPKTSGSTGTSNVSRTSVAVQNSTNGGCGAPGTSGGCSGTTNTSSSAIAAQNPGDGYCGAPNSCSNLKYNGGPVMNNAQFVIDVWAGQSYGSCNGYTIFEPGGGSSADCHYIFLQELYFQDFCAGSSQPASLFAIANQYTDSNQNTLSSCSLLGGSASESNSGFSVSYTYDPTSFSSQTQGSSCGGVSPCLTDGDVQQSAARAANAVACTQNGIRCEVLVLLPYNVCVDGFCPAGNVISYCAYHSYFTYSSNTLMYANMPDVYAAGNLCGAGVTYPTGDAIGDLEVSPLSHEADETITDPQLNAWYYNNLKHEIGDECAYDFVGTESFDGSNVHLGSSNSLWDPFEIQSEWSNFNGGCTLSMNGAPTPVYDTLTTDTSTGTAAQGWSFPIWLTEAGSTSFYTVPNFLTTSPGSTTVAFWQTPDTYIANQPSCPSSCLSSGSAYAFCYDQSCSYQDTYVTSTWTSYTSVSFVYYEYLEQQPYMNVIGGGSPPSVSMSYTVPLCNGFSACNGASDSTQVVSAALPTTPAADIFALWGSTASVPTNENGATNERWNTGGSGSTTTFNIGGEYSVGAINYYHQLQYFAKYHVAFGGSGYSAPKLHSTIFGSPASIALTTAKVGHWLDAGSAWTVSPNPLTGSNSGERWFSHQTLSGTVSTAGKVLHLKFLHQYYVTFTYNPGAAGRAPNSGWFDASTTGHLDKITAKAMSGYAFSSWGSLSGPVTLSSSATTNPNKMSVTGPGAVVNVNYIATVKVKLSSTSGSVAPGNSITLTATIKGGPQSVTLHHNKLATGIAVKFATNPITDSTSGVHDKVTISVGNSVAAGTYTITIHAKGADGKSGSATYTLTVT